MIKGTLLRNKVNSPGVGFTYRVIAASGSSITIQNTSSKVEWTCSRSYVERSYVVIEIPMAVAA